MKYLKKGQSVDFRNSGVPMYILEMREAANTLALEIAASEIACTTEGKSKSPRKKFISKLLNRQ